MDHCSQISTGQIGDQLLGLVKIEQHHPDSTDDLGLQRDEGIKSHT